MGVESWYGWDWGMLKYSQAKSTNGRVGWAVVGLLKIRWFDMSIIWCEDEEKPDETDVVIIINNIVKSTVVGLNGRQMNSRAAEVVYHCKT